MMMQRMKLLLLSSGVGLALAGVASSGAYASPVTVDVYIYDGASSIGTNANATTATAAAAAATGHYEFTNSGLNGLSWINNQSQTPTTPPPYNTGGQFVDFSHVLSFASCAGCGTESQFMSQTLSVPGDNDGHGGGTAMFVLSGTASGTILGGQITHDDGATFIWGGQTLLNSPGETSANAP